MGKADSVLMLMSMLDISNMKDGSAVLLMMSMVVFGGKACD